MDILFKRWASSEFVWIPEKGMGYFPVNPNDEPYDADYFAKYESYAKTPLGVALTDWRIKFVADHYEGEVIDIGIGCGQFVERRGEHERTLGYDVNPAGVAWLRARNRWREVRRVPYNLPALTFWDSLEHIDDPATILSGVQGWVFVSLPIFENCEDILNSKHFRKDEHRYYWTFQGFVNYMTLNGFTFISYSDAESRLGREGIRSFAFKRSG